MEATKRETDWTARCFQAVLIVLVVAGHVDGADLSGPFDLFDPYSFHVAGFAFVSGYLYSEAHDCKADAYVLNRFKRRLVPMFAIFAVYGCIATVLSHLFGFYFGRDISLSTLFIDTFTNGHQFELCYPMWFIAPFTLSQCVWVGLRWCLCKLIALTGAKGEGRAVDCLSLVVCVVLGGIAIEVGGSGLEEGVLMLVVRVLFFLPWFAFGRLYATVLRSGVERISGVTYFLCVIAVQLVLLWLCDGSVAYTPSLCCFPNGVLLTYLVTANGIAFWWGVCRYMAPLLSSDGKRVVDVLGGNSSSIMCHHVMGFFIVKCAFWMLTTVFGIGSFDTEAFLASVNYFYYPASITQFSAVYVIFGIAFSLGVHYVWLWLKQKASMLVRRVRD